MIFAIALGVTLSMSAIFEGRTIISCVRAAGRGSTSVLDRLGSKFLGSEAWVLASIGIGHAAYLEQFDIVMHTAGGAAIIYVAGWMLRDLFLWIGPRIGSPAIAPRLIALGAFGQLVGATWLIVAAIATLRGASVLATSGPKSLLAIVLLPVLVIGVIAQCALYRLPPARYFTWSPSRDSLSV